MNYQEYLDLLEKGEITINTNGHAVRTAPDEFWTILFMRSSCEIDEIEARIEDGRPIHSDLEFPLVEKGSYTFQCGKCSKKPTVTFYEDRIEFEDNHIEPEPFSVDIDFLSGEMVFNDTYPTCFDRGGDFNVNTVLGTQECSEHFASQGMMHFFVGNSCPAVWKEGDTIYVGRLPEGEWDNADGSICTDLWWASFVAPETIRSLGGSEKDIEYMRNQGSIQVEPGKYRCTSYYHLGNLDYYDDSEEKQVFCKLERIQSDG